MESNIWKKTEYALDEISYKDDEKTQEDHGFFKLFMKKNIIRTIFLKWFIGISSFFNKNFFIKWF